MKDWRGVMVQAGDRVIYSTRRSSSMDHNEGTVLALAGDTAVVEVVHSSNRWRTKNTVQVGGKNMTVVGGMPPYDAS